jgi:hypothetical protein
MAPAGYRPTVPSPGESSSGWPVNVPGQSVFRAQEARNQAMWAQQIANANMALAALAARSAALAARVAGDPRVNLDMIAKAHAQIAVETAFLIDVIAKCTAGTYSNAVPTVYTLENAKPFIGGGTF